MTAFLGHDQVSTLMCWKAKGRRPLQRWTHIWEVSDFVLESRKERANMSESLPSVGGNLLKWGPQRARLPFGEKAKCPWPTDLGLLAGPDRLQEHFAVPNNTDLDTNPQGVKIAPRG